MVFGGAVSGKQGGRAIYLCVKWNAEFSENTKSLLEVLASGVHKISGATIFYLRRASTTIKTTLLKGAVRGFAPASKTARPGKTGLYGKKPFAKMRIPRGRRKLTTATSSQELAAFMANSDLAKLEWLWFGALKPMLVRFHYYPGTCPLCNHISLSHVPP